MTCQVPRPTQPHRILLDMLSMKMDLLMKNLKDRANEKQEVMHIHDSRMTCEECGKSMNVIELPNLYKIKYGCPRLTR